MHLLRQPATVCLTLFCASSFLTMSYLLMYIVSCAVSSPFAHALHACDPRDRDVTFAITSGVRNVLQGMNEGNSPLR